MFGITKEQLSQLPTVSFPGRSILINTIADAKAAMAFLMRQQIVGFDTETRPSFRKGQPHKVALLQLSTNEECFLIRLNQLGMFESLKNFLENENILKIGLSLKDDFHSLMRLGEFNHAGFIELQTYVKEFDIADNSLQKIYGIIFGERISKSQRLTNWEANELTEAQQSYASLDAWACLKIFNHLKQGKFNPDECKYVLPEVEQQ